MKEYKTMGTVVTTPHAFLVIGVTAGELRTALRRLVELDAQKPEEFGIPADMSAAGDALWAEIQLAAGRRFDRLHSHVQTDPCVVLACAANRDFRDIPGKRPPAQEPQDG